MAFKIVIFSCLVALAQAGIAPVAAPVIGAPVVAAKLEQLDIPQYRFGYNVADSLTGDYKSQQEQRDGDLVQGQYSLVEPDGTRRVVDYSADSVNGFNAVVRKEPLVAAAPAVIAEPAVVPARLAAAPVAAPVVSAAVPAAAPIVAAPVAKYTAAYAAPLAYASYAAPVAKVAAYAAPAAVAPFARLSAYSTSVVSPFARLAAYPYAPAPVVAV